MEDLLGKSNEPRSGTDGDGVNASTAGQADGMGDQATYRTLLSPDAEPQEHFRFGCRAVKCRFSVSSRMPLLRHHRIPWACLLTW